MKLTDYEIRRHRLAGGVDEKLVFDERLPGFGVHFRRGGTNSFVVQYGSGKNRKRIAIGRVGELEAAKAFEIARDQLARIRLGADPALEKARARLNKRETVGLLLPQFLARQMSEWKERTHREATYSLSLHAKPFLPLPISAIDHRMIAARLGEIQATRGLGARNTFRAYLSTFFTWAMSEGLCDANPVDRTSKVTIAPRDRKLLDPELRVILTALNETARRDDDYRNLLKLSLYQGLRRDEVGRLRWSEVDLEREVISFPAGRLKNGKPWTVPLVGPSLEILKAPTLRLDPERPCLFVFGRRDSGFAGWSKAKKELDARITVLNGGNPLEPWVVHDFRRAIATTMTERLHVAPHVADAILGHAQAGVQAVYNLAQYVDERRHALEKWAAYLEMIVTDEAPAAKVISFDGRRR
jgi:integrase